MLEHCNLEYNFEVQQAKHINGVDILDAQKAKECVFATTAELEDRNLRIEDAKNATFAAIEEGIVPGGGAAFVHLSTLVPAVKEKIEDADERLGADII